MGKNKREERRERSQQAKEMKELQQRSAVTRKRLLLVAGVVAIGGIALVVALREDRPKGRVWSAAHGHYHDE